VDEQAAHRAEIMFRPSNGGEGLQRLRPRGVADEQGRFTISTYMPGDGAPVGDYQVSVVWRRSPSGPQAAELPEEELASGEDLLGGRYSDPATSDLVATVKAGDNQLPAFRLTVKGRKRSR
jgi:hypothetical protein